MHIYIYVCTSRVHKEACTGKAQDEVCVEREPYTSKALLQKRPRNLWSTYRADMLKEACRNETS